MFVLALLCIYLCFFSFVLGLRPVRWEQRPTLGTFGETPLFGKKKKQNIFSILRKITLINKPICVGALRNRISRDLLIAHVRLTPEEFIFIKEILVAIFVLIALPSVTADNMIGMCAFAFVFGYMGPELWLKGKIKGVKAAIVKDLPDAIDLLELCVNAGLDFMLALRWVIDKSPNSIMIEELNIVLQEINVGKTRREAIKDLALRYELPDLSTFARTLIQADKMGTSVTEALSILSEDMRIARYRRGEQLALKAPLKMLVPLLVFIFPVVGILVAGPIMLDFVENNPFEGVGKSK